jgi:DNA-binding CsgD family transcriptional regulator
MQRGRGLAGQSLGEGAGSDGGPEVLEALLLEAIARDVLGDPAATGRVAEYALDLADADAVLFPFLLHPAPGLLERHFRHRTGRTALISEILSLRAGASRPAPPAGEPAHPAGPISDSEIRVLRYLPTNLSAPEIATELTVSVNTIRTHVRRLYESSARAAVPKPSTGPAPSGCSHHPRADTEGDSACGLLGW